MITTTCPQPTYIGSVVTSLYPCPVEFGQIQKMIFWRRGTKLTIASVTQSTYWTTKLIATGNSKAVVTPFLIGKITAGAPRETGGTNDTKDGIPVVIGGLPSKAEFKAIQYSQTTIKALKKLMGETLDVVFINENGQFAYCGTQFNGTTAGFYGFPLAALFVGDFSLGQYDDKDENAVSFQMPSNWSDNMAITAATPFALTLINS